jgi:aldose sugar dehydrogenase
MRLPSLTAASFALALISCAPNSSNANSANIVAGPNGAPFNIEEVAKFDEPWAMTFLPGTPYALITEKKGKLMLWEKGGTVVEVKGAPPVAYGGQGGLADVIPAPDFAKSGIIYLSWAEAGSGDTFGAVVGMAKLNLKAAGGPALEGEKIIWSQYPKVDGRGHFGHRLAFSPDGKYLFIASGERQKFDPAQDMDSNLGKVVRLFPDGSIPKDNPFYAEDKPVRSQIWSLGHRNPLGLAFDDKGQLWNQEMGPKHGDELNLVLPKANYGYPKVSNGNHYDGRDIPDHSPSDGFEAPKVFWDPAISPGGLTFYNAGLFPAWKNSMFIGALGGKGLVRVKLDGTKAAKADQWDMGKRIREVETGPDGALWLLEDGGGARLLRLTPKK